MHLRDAHKLWLVVLAGTGARVLTLWLGRPDFTGWLNHSYYYFVQVRGLLETGHLPYPDMPLLFHVYAWIARVLMAVGMEPDPAVVASTRVVMCVAPALVALPVHGISRQLNDGGALSRAQWLLVGLSAFLPLSIGYLPEFLQKNTVGILLLATLVYATQRFALSGNRRAAGMVAGLGLLILVTHFGTLTAALLWGVAFVLSRAVVTRDVQTGIKAALAVAGFAAVAALAVRLLDAQRFERVGSYLRSSVSDSLLARVLLDEGSRAGAATSLLAVLALYALLVVLVRMWRRHGAGLRAERQVFWLANIVFCALLILPVLDEQLMGRLSTFALVPAVVLLLHVERFVLAKPWQKIAVVTLAATAVAALAAGELVSARVHNRDHAAVARDLRELRRRGSFGTGDLVLTRTGADHICNWFFRVRAGVVPSLSIADFERYDRIFILNPRDGLGLPRMEAKPGLSERDRYYFMRHNLPIPPEAELRYRSEALELYELPAPPAGWVFANDGSWMGYGR